MAARGLFFQTENPYKAASNTMAQAGNTLGHTRPTGSKTQTQSDPTELALSAAILGPSVYKKYKGMFQDFQGDPTAAAANPKGIPDPVASGDPTSNGVGGQQLGQITTTGQETVQATSQAVNAGLPSAEAGHIAASEGLSGAVATEAGAGAGAGAMTEAAAAQSAGAQMAAGATTAAASQAATTASAATTAATVASTTAAGSAAGAGAGAAAGAEAGAATGNPYAVAGGIVVGLAASLFA